jgi:hypothetical protein
MNDTHDRDDDFVVISEFPSDLPSVEPTPGVINEFAPVSEVSSLPSDIEPLPTSDLGDAALQLAEENSDTLISAAKAALPIAGKVGSVLATGAAFLGPAAAVAATAAGAGYLGYKIGERLVESETVKNALEAVAPTGSSAFTISSLEKAAIAKGKPPFTEAQKASLRKRGIADYDFDESLDTKTRVFGVYPRTLYELGQQQDKDLSKVQILIATIEPKAKRHPALWAYAKLVHEIAPGVLACLPVRETRAAFERMTKDGGQGLMILVDAARAIMTRGRRVDQYPQSMRQSLTRFLESLGFMKRVIDEPEQALTLMVSAMEKADLDAECRCKHRYKTKLDDFSLDEVMKRDDKPDLAEYLCLSDAARHYGLSPDAEVRYFSLSKTFKKVTKAAIPIVKIALPVLAGAVGAVVGGPIGAALAASLTTMLTSRLGGSDDTIQDVRSADPNAMGDGQTVIASLVDAASSIAPHMVPALNDTFSFPPLPDDNGGYDGSSNSESA